MSITDAQYDRWLSDLNARRVLLVEMEHSDGTEYVASSPYVSLPSDSDPNRLYNDVLVRAVDISTRIDGLIGFGELELVDDGELTSWRAFAWRGWPVRLYLGDPEWSRDDFRLLAHARNGGISRATRGELIFIVEDNSSALAEPIDTGRIPEAFGGGPVPLALGHCYNTPTTRVSTQALTYRVSFLAIGTSPNPPVVKDNGVSVSMTVSGGTFTLNAPPAGVVTCDVKNSINTPVAIVNWVASRYGFSVAAADLPAYEVGLYYDDEVSGAQILDDLCEGLGAYWHLNEANELVVKQHTAPGTPEEWLADDDLTYGSIELIETESPWRKLTLRWGRNHSVLSTVASSIIQNEPEEAARLQSDWRESSATQAVPAYPLAEDVVRETPIQNAADAEAERDRLLALRSVRREVWRAEAFFPRMDVGVTIGVLQADLDGRPCVVKSINRSPTLEVTELEIWL